MSDNATGDVLLPADVPPRRRRHAFASPLGLAWLFTLLVTACLWVVRNSELRRAALRQEAHRLGLQVSPRLALAAEGLDLRCHGLAGQRGAPGALQLHRADPRHRLAAGAAPHLRHLDFLQWLSERPGLRCGAGDPGALLAGDDRHRDCHGALCARLAARPPGRGVLYLFGRVRAVGECHGHALLDHDCGAHRRRRRPLDRDRRLSLALVRACHHAGSRPHADGPDFCLSGADPLPLRLRAGGCDDRHHVYAMPPMVRVTMLALRALPSEIIDLGNMVGCTRRQTDLEGA